MSIAAWKDGFVGELEAERIEVNQILHREVFLELSATISGRVFDGISKAPIEGVRVWVDTFSHHAHAVTDGSGTYVLQRFPATGVGLTVRYRAQSHGTESVVLAAYSDGTWRKYFTSDEGDEEAKKRPSPAIVDVELTRALKIFGGVQNTQGVPLAGADVLVRGYYKMGEGFALPDESKCRSDELGSFVLEALRSDIGHQVRVSHPGYGTFAAILPPEPSGRQDCGVIQLAPEVPLSGTVVDAEGVPVEGLEVWLTAVDLPADLRAEQGSATAGRDPDVWDSLVRRARTSGEGIFLFRQLAIGRYEIKVAESGRSLEERLVELAEEGLPGGVDFQLSPTEAVLTGRVMRGDQPTAGAQVVLTCGVWRRFVTADATGRFRITSMTRDTSYELSSVVIDRDSGEPRWSEVYDVDSNSGYVEIRWN